MEKTEWSEVKGVRRGGDDLAEAEGRLRRPDRNHSWGEKKPCLLAIGSWEREMEQGEINERVWAERLTESEEQKEKPQEQETQLRGWKMSKTASIKK